MIPADFQERTSLASRFTFFLVAAFVATNKKHLPGFSCHFRNKTAIKFLCGPVLALFLSDANAGGLNDRRGEMLYKNHCIACHTTQVHWREQRLAKDWASLRVQVRRWERNTGLSWSDEDVEAVSRYLNQLYYEFPDTPRDKTISLLRSYGSTAHPLTAAP